ncbi:hypothetical protein FACS189499_01480 [Clostridia bacterium]|nr:hypothetical protein FACS189499_01480 [Clostridia bacterium]
MDIDYKSLMEVAAGEYFSSGNFAPDSETVAAMKYCFHSGGKRIRPAVLLESCRLLGGSVEKAVPAALAIEFIHTFSLIHDDLPCMDNDDFRRGMASCHKQFSESTALLAGDALIVAAFSILAKYDYSTVLIQKAAEYTGIRGMIGGQESDIRFTRSEHMPTEADILAMYSQKTGALLSFSAFAGAVIAGAERDDAEKFAEYGDALGLAFQLVDDLLDADDESGISFVTLFGKEKTREQAAFYTNKALGILENFPGNEKLTELTKNLLERKQ